MKIDDHWLRPRTKAGTEEMRRRLNSMREILQAAAKTERSALPDAIEAKFNLALFNEYFTFDWE